MRLRLDQVQVADGRWHDLQLELRDVRSGRETRYVATLRLDFGLYQGVRLGVRPDAPALPRPSRAVKVETGCNVGNPCVSSPCPAHSRCTDVWERHTCLCEPGEGTHRRTHDDCSLHEVLLQNHFTAKYISIVSKFTFSW
ncbi:hypothetical protein XENOCAPTIV_024592 [Xenoophorus captivus]|uniref:EGF-like domain-containing protein n=1 Tax=Xenoophorus captivus TaxID=1517983 RepID=A0ABV0Q420_9TELE